MDRKLSPKYTAVQLLLLTLMMFALAGCQGGVVQNAPTEQAPLDLETTPLVSATGVVRPAEWARLSMPATGRVAEVLVKKGDSVIAGQALVLLEGKEDLQSAISTAQFELAAAEKALEDLEGSTETYRTAALQAMASFARQVRDAQYQIDHFTIPTNQKNMQAWEAVQIMQQKLNKARQAFEPWKNRPTNDPTREDLQEALDEAQSDYNTAVRRLELDTALQVAQANLKEAEDDFNTWKNGPDPKEAALAQRRIENARAALSAAQSHLADLELRAPFAGVITELDVRTGEWVTMGQPLILLADLSRLQVETTDLNEIDAARVRPGDQVKLSFDALPQAAMQATVSSIALKPAEGAGVNYTTVIAMDQIPEGLRWGMTAFVDITVSE